MIAIDRWAKTVLGIVIVALAVIAIIVAAVALIAIAMPLLLGMVRAVDAAGPNPIIQNRGWQPPIIDARDRYDGGNSTLVSNIEVDLALEDGCQVVADTPADVDTPADDRSDSIPLRPIPAPAPPPAGDDGSGGAIDVAADVNLAGDAGEDCDDEFIDIDLDADLDLGGDDNREDEPLGIDLL